MIPETVRLDFDPAKSSEVIQEIFKNDTARVLFLAIRGYCVVDQNFFQNCLVAAGIINRVKKDKGTITMDWLFQILSDKNLIGHGEREFVSQLLLFVNGWKEINYTVN